MKNSYILILALAGLAGIGVGGTVWGVLGVASLLLAVWAVCENGRLRDLNAELDRAYGVSGNPRVPFVSRPRRSQLVLSPVR